MKREICIMFFCAEHVQYVFIGGRSDCVVVLVIGYNILYDRVYILCEKNRIEI